MELKYWKSEAVSAKIRAIYSADKAMQPEQQQALKAHLQAIAKILYDDSDPDAMQTLEGIEMTVRQKIQAHVSPELGIFLLARLQEQQQDDPER